MKLKVFGAVIIIARVGLSLIGFDKNNTNSGVEIALAASAILLQEDFESDLSRWQITALPPNQATLYGFALNDDFEENLDGWARIGAVTTTTSPVYGGNTALLLNGQGTYGDASRTFPSNTNLRARVYFYDSGAATLDTIFQLVGSGSQINCGTGAVPQWNQPNTGLGIKSDLTGSYYVIQINCPEAVGDDHGVFVAEETKPDLTAVSVPRRIGWHLFELLITPVGTYARIDDRQISRLNPDQTDVVSVTFSSTEGQAVYDSLAIQAGYQSDQSLLLDYIDSDGQNEDALTVSRDFIASQNILARTFFFDNMDSAMNTVFAVTDATETWQTGIGVVPASSRTNYSLRFDSPSSTSDTGIHRSAGWHMFEIIVTDRGAYAKIDNNLVAEFNPSHTSAARINYISGQGVDAGSVGTAIYDDLLVVAADETDWKDQLYTPLEVHYKAYSQLTPPDDAVIFAGLYPQLGYCPPGADRRTCGVGSNDLRTIMGSAMAWYLYGLKTNDARATSLAKRVFLEGWANAPWHRPGQDVDDWARGASMRMVAYAAYTLWADLEPDMRDEVVQELYAQAQTYADRLPESGYIGDTKAEENAWHAAFLAAVVNLFPEGVNDDNQWLEPKARCFAYHAITQASDDPYCGLTTQTVWPDWHLENRGQDNPAYTSGTLSLLGEAAFTYRLAGRPIPWEFTHNVRPLFEKYIIYLDQNSYHYLNVSPDWDGAHNSAFISPTAFRYMDILGIPTGISWQDYMSKRSIFYYEISSSWLKKAPSHIRIREWNQREQNEDSYKFFLDSVDAGEFYSMAIYSLDIVPDQDPVIFLPLIVKQ